MVTSASSCHSCVDYLNDLDLTSNYDGASIPRPGNTSVTSARCPARHGTYKPSKIVAVINRGTPWLWTNPMLHRFFVHSFLGDAAAGNLIMQPSLLSSQEK